MQVLKHSLLIDAPPGEVWRILTTPELVKEWAAAWVDGMSIRTTWRPGEEVAWKMPGGATRSRGAVAACEPGRLLKFEYTQSVVTPEGRAFCDTFELTEADEGTRLDFTSGPFDEATRAQLEAPTEQAAREIKSLAEESAEIQRGLASAPRRAAAAAAV
ncbi:MAG: SRPBCC family protein [Pseudomonadota bacterium]